MSDTDIADTSLRPTETVCPCHHLAYNRFLPACPIAAAEAPTPWSPKP